MGRLNGAPQAESTIAPRPVPLAPHSPHDLLRIAGPAALAPDPSCPAWADASLREAPWVVVRRARPLGRFLPVGIRGASRAERRAAWLPAASVLAALTPQSLGQSEAWRHARRTIPAIAALDELAGILAGFDWGPGGSVGFELASGCPAARPDSDLDIVVSAPDRIEAEAARELRRRLDGSPVRVDLGFETPLGAVALSELTSPNEFRVVKTPDGPRLVRDPWSENGGEP